MEVNLLITLIPWPWVIANIMSPHVFRCWIGSLASITSTHSSFLWTTCQTCRSRLQLQLFMSIYVWPTYHGEEKSVFPQYIEVYRTLIVLSSEPLIRLSLDSTSEKHVTAFLCSFTSHTSVADCPFMFQTCSKKHDWLHKLFFFVIDYTHTL